MLSSLLVGLVFVQMFSTMSLVITRGGYSESIYGLLISMNGAMIVLCELPITTITKRLRPRPVMALGYLLVGAGFCSNMLPRNLPLLALSTSMLTLGEMIAMPVAGAYVADLAPADRRGLYMGTYGMIWALAFVAGPSLGLMIYSWNPLWLWVICGLLGIAAASLISAGSRGAGAQALVRLTQRLSGIVR